MIFSRTLFCKNIKDQILKLFDIQVKMSQSFLFLIFMTFSFLFPKRVLHARLDIIHFNGKFSMTSLNI